MMPCVEVAQQDPGLALAGLRMEVEILAQTLTIGFTLTEEQLGSRAAIEAQAAKPRDPQAASMKSRCDLTWRFAAPAAREKKARG